MMCEVCSAHKPLVDNEDGPKDIRKISNNTIKRTFQQNAQQNSIPKAGSWSCSMCTFLNKPTSTQCEVCYHTPQTTMNECKQDNDNKAKGWACSHCAFPNKAHSEKCEVCGQLPLPDNHLQIYPGWEVHKDDQGRFYFFNLKTKNSQWLDPRPLPPGWESQKDEEGQIYFVCHSARRTTWTDPRPCVKAFFEANPADQSLLTPDLKNKKGTFTGFNVDIAPDDGDDSDQDATPTPKTKDKSQFSPSPSPASKSSKSPGSAGASPSSSSNFVLKAKEAATTAAPTAAYWACTLCSFHNSNMKATRCGVCNNMRVQNAAIYHQPCGKQVSRVGDKSSYDKGSDKGSDKSSLTLDIKLEKHYAPENSPKQVVVTTNRDAWTCRLCAFSNAQTNVVCEICQTGKPKPAPRKESGERLGSMPSLRIHRRSQELSGPPLGGDRGSVSEPARVEEVDFLDLIDPLGGGQGDTSAISLDGLAELLGIPKASRTVAVAVAVATVGGKHKAAKHVASGGGPQAVPVPIPVKGDAARKPQTPRQVGKLKIHDQFDPFAQHNIHKETTTETLDHEAAAIEEERRKVAMQKEQLLKEKALFEEQKQLMEKRELVLKEQGQLQAQERERARLAEAQRVEQEELARQRVRLTEQQRQLQQQLQLQRQQQEKAAETLKREYQAQHQAELQRLQAQQQAELQRQQAELAKQKKLLEQNAQEQLKRQQAAQEAQLRSQQEELDQHRARIDQATKNIEAHARQAQGVLEEDQHVDDSYDPFAETNLYDIIPDDDDESEADRAKREEHYNKVAEEIVASEANYMFYLNTLITRFIRPLNTDAEKLRLGGGLSKLFMFFTSITKLHSFVLMEFHKAQKEGKLVASVMLKYTDFFKLYQSYILDYDEIVARLNLLEHNKTFKKYMCKIQEEANDGMTLASFLIMPIQRIPRYCLLLRELQKFTRPYQYRHKVQQQAMEKMKHLADELNENKRRFENQSKLLHIQSQIKTPPEMIICKPYRLFIREDKLGLSQKKDRKYNFCVFNDGILRISLNWNVKEMLSATCIELPFEEEGDTNLSVSHGGQVVWTLIFISAQDRENWSNDVAKMITNSHQGDARPPPEPPIVKSKKGLFG